MDYFQLRSADAQQRLLDDTVKAKVPAGDREYEVIDIKYI